MKLNDYVKAMDEVHADQEKLLNKLLKKEPVEFDRHPRFFLRTCTALLVFVLLSAAVRNASFSGQEPGCSVIVHAAAADAVILPGEASFVQCSADPFMGVFCPDFQNGVVNYDLWLECAGEDIVSVTYRCQDIPVTLKNFGNVSCYFVRNRDIPVEDRDQCDYIRMLVDTDQGICHITELVGNEYTVPYEDQERPGAGIEVHVTQVSPEGDTAKADPFQVDVLTTLTDGRVRTQTLLMTPEDNALDGLKIELLE